MKRPAAIWLCLVFSAALALPAAWGLLTGFMRLAAWVQVSGAVRAIMALAIQAALVLFLVAVFHAAITRPRWGRALCGLFAVMLAASVAHGALHPDPHPLFPIKPGAEEAGARIGAWAMVMLAGFYAYRMVLGASVREYFASHKPGQAATRSGRNGVASG